MTDRPSVHIARCATYDTPSVENALSECLAAFGGIGAFVRDGDRVLLKPNLLARATPDRAVTTHPALVRATIRAVQAAGGVVTVGDSPGGRMTVAGAHRIFESTGMRDVCAETGARLVLLDDDVVRVPSPGGALYGAFTLGREAVEADVLIDLPKLKTHGFMMFTGAVKNLFGCIPGLEKAQYHLKVPERDDFASMLLDIMLTLRPALSIMDAVVGMEGQGPAGGSPVKLGAIIASPDAPSLDAVAAAIAGLDVGEVYTCRVAAARGLGPASADDVTVSGVAWRELRPPHFALPARDLTSLLPRGLRDPLRSALLPRPGLKRESACSRCKACERDCPVGAIVVGEAGPVFDLRLCIRCYCCQELCPVQAIALDVPPLGRLLGASRGRDS